MAYAGCVLEVYHEAYWKDRVRNRTPGGLSKEECKEMKKWRKKHMVACIKIDEEHAELIVQKIWPGEGLLGATCGQAFHIETQEMADIVNEVLTEKIRIGFNKDLHRWALQTWPL